MAIEQRATSGRAAYVISQLYYYVAAVVGVGLLLGGLIASLLAARHLALPQEFETTRQSVRDILNGLAFALPGAVVLWWHIREARRRESAHRGTAFWGKSLYYHLVALIALGSVLGGAVRVLTAAVDAALPRCFPTFGSPIPAFAEPSGTCVRAAAPPGPRPDRRRRHRPADRIPPAAIMNGR